MHDTPTAAPSNAPFRLQPVTLPAFLGILFGLVMPLVAILLFRTYTDSMPIMWLERTRLLELHFVASEMAVVFLARSRGFEIAALWRQIPRDVRTALFVVLFAMLFSSCVLATVPSDALLQSIIQLIHGLFALAVYFLAREAQSTDWSQMGAWLMAGLPVIALATIWWFSVAPPEDSLPGGKIVWDQAVPGFISIRYLGTWLGGIAAFLALKQLYRDRNDRLTAAHFLLMLVLAYTFWTGTRAAVVGLGVAALGSALTVGRLPTLRAMLVGMSIAASALALAIMLGSDNPAFALYGAEDLTSTSNFTAGRTELWAATLERWAQSPWFGWGTGSLVWDVDIGWHHTQPHNAFVQFGENWGIIGLAALCWIFWRAISVALRRCRANEALLPVLAMVLALLGMSMFDGALYYPRFIIMIMLGFAIMLASDGEAPNSHKVPAVP